MDLSILFGVQAQAQAQALMERWRYGHHPLLYSSCTLYNLTHVILPYLLTSCLPHSFAPFWPLKRCYWTKCPTTISRTLITTDTTFPECRYDIDMTPTKSQGKIAHEKRNPTPSPAILMKFRNRPLHLLKSFSRLWCNTTRIKREKGFLPFIHLPHLVPTYPCN